MDEKDYLKRRLKSYHKSDIIITDHAQEQALFRNIGIAEIKENIINPFRLSYAKREKAKKPDEEKFDTYFGYSKTQCHRYILVINKRCIVCTVIKINRRWQHIAEKHAKV